VAERTLAVVLVIGDEEFLVDRAVAAATRHPGGADVEVRELSASDLEPGQLAELTSPSLFGEARVVVVRDAELTGKDVADEILAGCRDALAGDGEVRLVLVHKGGARGKVLVDAAVAAGARRVECGKLTRPSDRIDFVRTEFAAGGRSVSDDAARTLLDAVGADLRELAAACAQLASDVSGTIDATEIRRYYRGRPEANGFAVADRAIEGRLAEALEQLRWALAVGTAPVLIGSALAQGLRSLAKVASLPRGMRPADMARELAMPPWKIDRVRAQLRGWTPAAVAAAVRAVADADAALKGGGTDPGYALEKAVMAVVAARGA
jgi:DNA polymerase III delta subunit